MNTFTGKLPIFLQLKMEIEDVILSTNLKAEDPVPSIRTLAAEYSINPLTVSRTIGELEVEGIIYKKRGIGFFVTDQAFEIIRRKRMAEYFETEVKSFVQKAVQLGIKLERIQDLIRETYEEESHGKHHGN
ncbi:MAG: GntR family transcriptional regulator [Candidatus Cloacimonetes bacterium]|nr:GntR family transcriptional regulator [Candidatus Cloacimonadota bacterium]